MKQAHRFSGPGAAYEGLTQLTKNGPVWTGDVRMAKDHLLDPHRWREPQMIFVNSMSDLFHESLSDEAINQIFDVMQSCPQHVFQVLTKRPQRMLYFCKQRVQLCDRMRDQVSDDDTDGEKEVGKSFRWPLPNVWMGVSCENQQCADERIPLLLQTPAAVRWLSIEPLIGHIDLIGKDEQGSCLHPYENDPRIDWVVVGGESGPGARPMDPQWARYIRDCCVDAKVPFFFKQWGEWAPLDQTSAKSSSRRELKRLESGVEVFKLGKHATGRTLDGREWSEYPSTQQSALSTQPRQ
jgi:protein gp37